LEEIVVGNVFVAVNGGGTNFSLDGDRSVHYMVAMYSYNPIELSPNVDADVRVFSLHAVDMCLSVCLCISS